MPNPAKATTEAGNEARKAETVDAAEILVEVALHGQPGVGKTHVLASLFDWIAASNGFIVTDFVASEHFLEVHKAIVNRTFCPEHRTMHSRPEFLKFTICHGGYGSDRSSVTWEVTAHVGELSGVAPTFRKAFEKTRGAGPSVLLQVINPFRVSEELARKALLLLFAEIQRQHPGVSPDFAFHAACSSLFAFNRERVQKIVGSHFILAMDRTTTLEDPVNEKQPMRDLEYVAMSVARVAVSETRQFLLKARSLLNGTYHNLVICTHMDLFAQLDSERKHPFITELRQKVQKSLELRGTPRRRPVRLVTKPGIVTEFSRQPDGLDLHFVGFAPPFAQEVTRWITWPGRIKALGRSVRWRRWAFGPFRMNNRRRYRGAAFHLKSFKVLLERFADGAGG